jgi:hypothetical protein
MGVKKSPSIREKGPKVAAMEALSKGRRANLCNCAHNCAGTPVAIVGGRAVASPWWRHGSLS